MWALSLKNTWDSHVSGDSLEGLRKGCGITGHVWRCLSVMTFSATSFVSTREFRYVRVYYRLFLIFNSWIFDKPFRSEVMA